MENLLAGKRIFIVEDKLANRMIFKTLLERHGAVILFDNWGNETSEKLNAAQPIDLIIMDLMLPGRLTGYEVVAELRKRSVVGAIPIVAVSAADPSEAIPKAREHGFDGFISKPIDFVLFPQQLRQLLDKQQIWHSA